MLGGEGFRLKKVVNLGSGEVHVPQRPKRRRFSADYKLKILAEAEACKGTGQVAAMLQREGLYHLSGCWRSQKKARRCFVWVTGGIGRPEFQRGVEEPGARVSLSA
jgi:hypothetical protein